MGFIEEGRQLIQDFVTPEIRSIDARLTALEKKMEAFESKVDKRFDAADGKIDRVQTSLEAKIDRNHMQVMDTLHRMEIYSQVLERLARLESKLQNVA
jgi:hypothetical protein